jgi:hypothetical protein
MNVALNDEQWLELDELLTKSRGAAVGAEIRTILAGAAKRVNESVEELQRHPSEHAARRTATVIDASRADALRAEELAKEAKLEEEQQRARELYAQLGELRKQLPD